MVKAVNFSLSSLCDTLPPTFSGRAPYSTSFKAPRVPGSFSPVALSTLTPESTQSKSRARAVANTIGDFLQRNWKHLLLYILAWSLILICHSSVAVVLSIWLGIGFGAGVIFGIISANFLDKQNKYPQLNSLWNITNHGLQQLDANGTRQVLLATIIASISALIYASPQAIGFIIGAFLGNQTSTIAIYSRRFQSGPGYIADQKLFEKQEKQIRQAIAQCRLVRNQMILQQRLDWLQKRCSRSHVASTKTITIRPLTGRISLPEDLEDEIAHQKPKTAIACLDNKISQLNQMLVQLYDSPTRVIEQ